MCLFVTFEYIYIYKYRLVASKIYQYHHYVSRIKLLAFSFLLLALTPVISKAASILIPMDDEQKNHLKSYGIAFWTLKNGEEVDWLLNYRGGSFMMKYNPKVEEECKVRGVSYQVLADAKVNEILTEVIEE